MLNPCAVCKNQESKSLESEAECVLYAIGVILAQSGGPVTQILSPPSGSLHFSEIRSDSK